MPLLCPSPFELPTGRKVPCGGCIACRVNLKQSWAGRLTLEHLHTRGPSTWLTLTYADSHLPIREGKPSLNPDDWRVFYDRLRQTTGLGQVRFYAVGEYGDKFERPHYHAILFGVDPFRWRSRIERCWSVDPKAEDPEMLGGTQTALVSPGRITYIAEYAVKRTTGALAEDRLAGRHPEFSRMTRRRPLGIQGMCKMRDALTKREGALGLAAQGDVPSRFRLDGRTYPLTEYWKDWLRVELGVEKPSFSEWELVAYESQRDRSEAVRAADKLWRRHKRKKAMSGL